MGSVGVEVCVEWTAALCESEEVSEAGSGREWDSAEYAGF
jgi:hypothetical protein